MQPQTLPVTELFYTIRGEGYWSGTPATFIRLGTCNLACPGCDTEFNNWAWMSFTELEAFLTRTGCDDVVITGGEPLVHARKLSEFLTAIGKNHIYDVQIETNGTRPLGPLRTLISPWLWITVSPKVGAPKALRPRFQGNVPRPGTEVVLKNLSEETLEFASELKFIVGGGMYSPVALWEAIGPKGGAQTPLVYLQPWMDDQYQDNLATAIQLVKEYPDRWKLSLQMHKAAHIR